MPTLKAGAKINKLIYYYYGRSGHITTPTLIGRNASLAKCYTNRIHCMNLTFTLSTVISCGLRNIQN